MGVVQNDSMPTISNPTMPCEEQWLSTDETSDAAGFTSV
jgi:hypothetical protein